MPEHVCLLIEHALVVGRDRFARLDVDVRLAREGAAAAGIGAHRVLQRAEALAEGDLAFVVEALAAEQQDGVFLERRTDRRERRVVHGPAGVRSEEHTSELPSLMRTSYAVF